MDAAVRVLSAGAPTAGVVGCAEAFEDAGGHHVALSFATATAIRERIGQGEAGADIVIAPAPLVAEFETRGRTVAGAVVIGSVRTGVVVRAGAAVPDISSAAALKRALLGADAVIYNEASSGLFIARLLARLGVAEALSERTVLVPDAAAVMRRLAAGTAEREIGFGQLTAIRRHAAAGVRLVGALPDEIGNVTTYAAALLAAAEAPDAAGAFLAFLATPEARRILTAAGLA